MRTVRSLMAGATIVLAMCGVRNPYEPIPNVIKRCLVYAPSEAPIITAPRASVTPFVLWRSSRSLERFHPRRFTVAPETSMEQDKENTKIGKRPVGP
ncbi:hypothetical protein F4677DRAFT_224446 [Hypoxylon crocopeplum]|nr:hypothetical protein F4677DRAFT_224446 [Hypoxylon crocopeplum]